MASWFKWKAYKLHCIQICPTEMKSMKHDNIARIDWIRLMRLLFGGWIDWALWNLLNDKQCSEKEECRQVWFCDTTFPVICPLFNCSRKLQNQMFACRCRLIPTGEILETSSWIVLKRSFSTPSVRVVAEDVPVVIKKAAEKAVKEASEFEQQTVTQSTFNQRISYFLCGFLLATGGLMYYLQKDINQSNMQLQDAITAMKNDELARLEEMEKKIAQLEERLN